MNTRLTCHSARKKQWLANGYCPLDRVRFENRQHSFCHVQEAHGVTVSLAGVANKARKQHQTHKQIDIQFD